MKSKNHPSPYGCPKRSFSRSMLQGSPVRSRPPRTVRPRLIWKTSIFPTRLGARALLSTRLASSLIDASLQSEKPAKCRARQYFMAWPQVTALPLSFAAHISLVVGSIQYPRVCVSCDSFCLSCACFSSSSRICCNSTCGTRGVASGRAGFTVDCAAAIMGKLDMRTRRARVGNFISNAPDNATSARLSRPSALFPILDSLYFPAAPR